ncbi:hypothetical protein KDL44_08015 [bacterium]|nr:hypothetical protein [bacterium]
MPTRIRRYEEKLENLDSLLSRIEREMGPQAQLEAREFRRNGVLGLGGQRMVEIIATLSLEEQHGDVLADSAVQPGNDQQRQLEDPSDDDIRRELLAGYDSAGADNAAAATPRPAAAREYMTTRLDGNAGSRLRDAFARNETPPLQPASQPQPRLQPQPVAVQPSLADTGREDAELRASLDEIRGLLGDLAQRQREHERLLREQADASRGMPVRFASELERLEQSFRAQREELEQRQQARLQEQAVPAGNQLPTEGPLANVLNTLLEWNIPLADSRELLQEAQQGLDPDADETALLAAVRREICRGVLLRGGLRVKPGERRVVALVGPTGVGKTTTIAKLAAQAVFSQDLRVAVVSMDNYRIAAAEQLRNYAEIMGLRFEIVFSPQEYAETLERLADFDLILVDTAGRSPNSAEHIAETRVMLEAGQPDEVHLVLSAGMQLGDARRSLEAFSVLGCGQLILSKLDECVGLGGIHNIGRLCSLPQSYFTTGQSVPEDIRSADPDFMTELMQTGVELQ